ncbi:MAG: cytochrome c [Pseudomonadota bacterium]
MFKKLFLALIWLLLAAALAFYAWSWQGEMAPVAKPAPSAFSPQLIAKGEMLAGIGNCAACHTVKGRAPFAGGRPLATPFGDIHATNITPDTETGIGNWSQAAFQRAMREGVRRDGEHLFPVFPYTHFNLVSDEDLSALYAYFMTRAPVHAEALENALPFPLNVRALQAGWKLLFFAPRPLPTDVGKSVDWNRGRYLAEGLAHCAACHTPRNRLGAEIAASSYLGAPIDGWFAPALTAANPAPLPWTEAELTSYLRLGATALHGVAAGPMSEVVHQGLKLAPDADIHALAVYFADLSQAGLAAPNARATLQQAMARPVPASGQSSERGASLYLAACAACHSNSNGAPQLLRPELTLNSALTAPDPANLLRVIVHGVGRDEGLPAVLMPPFGAALSDRDIAELAGYLRRTRTDLPPWPELEAGVAAARRRQP